MPASTRGRPALLGLAELGWQCRVDVWTTRADAEEMAQRERDKRGPRHVSEVLPMDPELRSTNYGFVVWTPPRRR